MGLSLEFSASFATHSSSMRSWQHIRVGLAGSFFLVALACPRPAILHVGAFSLPLYIVHMYRGNRGGTMKGHDQSRP